MSAEEVVLASILFLVGFVAGALLIAFAATPPDQAVCDYLHGTMHGDVCIRGGHVVRVQ